jgi:UDP-N-acetyl-D-glucosamine dehydrogenase
VLARGGIALANARILVVGIAYKPDVSDLRESPAIEILSGLAEHGATVGFVDNHFAGVRLPDGRLVDAVIDAAGFDADLILLHTKHTGTDLTWVRTDQLVLDATYRDSELAQSRVI